MWDCGECEGEREVGLVHSPMHGLAGLLTLTVHILHEQYVCEDVTYVCEDV